MFLFVPLIAIALFFGMWLSRRGSTLTRDCRWRPDRTVGPRHFRCAACGAECDISKGVEPRQCLRGTIIRVQQ